MSFQTIKKVKSSNDVTMPCQLLLTITRKESQKVTLKVFSYKKWDFFLSMLIRTLFESLICRTKLLQPSDNEVTLVAVQ